MNSLLIAAQSITLFIMVVFTFSCISDVKNGYPIQSIVLLIVFDFIIYCTGAFSCFFPSIF